MSYQTVKSVKKAIAILELLTTQSIEKKEMTLSEISKETGILPVTARNLLRTLEECGYASRVGHGLYREGDRCFKLFRNEGVFKKLQEVAAPIIKERVDDLGESILLVSIINNKRVELFRCQAPDDDMKSPQWKANALFYRMRTTRAVLAWFSDQQLESFVEANGLPTLDEWPECNGSMEGMKKELSNIRKRGGCCDEHGEYIAISIPILTSGNEVVASIGCYAQKSRTDKVREAGICVMLKECAELIQEKMRS